METRQDRGMADALPAWSLPAGAERDIAMPAGWPERLTAAWAFGEADGAGVRVCLLDSGVTPHPLVAAQHALKVADGRIEEDDEGDRSGHGTACGGIIRALAPACSLTSVRVLAGPRGSGATLIEGLRWAIEERFDIVNMSLSTTRQDYVPILHELADRAYFSGT